jgi:hypothetical protein
MKGDDYMLELINYYEKFNNEKLLKQKQKATDKLLDIYHLRYFNRSNLKVKRLLNNYTNLLHANITSIEIVLNRRGL